MRFKNPIIIFVKLKFELTDSCLKGIEQIKSEILAAGPMWEDENNCNVIEIQTENRFFNYPGIVGIRTY